MRLKRVLAVLLACMMVVGIPLFAYAETEEELENNLAAVSDGVEDAANTDDADEDADPTANKDSMPVDIKAKNAILMDVTTGKVLLAYNEDEKIFPASVTKIMTLLLVMEAVESGKIGLTDMVTTSEYAESMGGSEIWLEVGEQMSVDDLIKAACVASANDACVALGEYVAGSNEAFVKMMNERAKELGMENTNFENCTGLDDTATNHLTTARDVGLMSVELLKHELIIEYSTIWMDSLRNGETELVNTNRLVRWYEGATGLKTGTTSKAGICVSASAKRGETHLVAVVMGSSTSDDRFNTAQSLLNWGFSNWETVTPQVDYNQISAVKIMNGSEKSLMPEIEEVQPILVRKGTEDSVEMSVALNDSVSAPVEEGQTLGTVFFKVGDEVVGEYRLIAPKYVEKMTFFRAFRELLKGPMNNL